MGLRLFESARRVARARISARARSTGHDRALFQRRWPAANGRYGMVVPSFVRQAIRGEPITVYGSGEQTRCFGHVADAVESVVRLSNCEAAIGQVVNVGTDEEISILALAERVRELAESNSEIVLVPYEEAYAEGFEDMLRRVPDLSRLESLTGFRPRTALDVTIESVLEDLRVSRPY